MRLDRFGFAAVLGVAGLLAAPALGHEEKIDLAKVPAGVKQAAAKAVPGAKWESATKETEKGKTTYEQQVAAIRGDAPAPVQ